MKIIKKLPHWVLTNLRPAFYDTDSGTAVEQTALLYKKMQELIDNYNTFVDEINTTIEEFIANTESDQEEFEIKINQMIHDFTSLVRLEIGNQNKVLDDFINEMSDNLSNTVQVFLVDLFESGRVKLNFEYNGENESLDITGIVITEGSGE